MGHMSASRIPYCPEQQRLLPSALQDWLPEGHLAYFIIDTVDSLELGAFHARYAVGGPRNQPFHPPMMVKILVYAYATGTFSSRKIARKLHEDVAFRVLAADNFPAHRTIRDFRALHLAEFTELFVQVVRQAREMGLVKLGRRTKESGLPQAQVDCRATQRLDQECTGVKAAQHAGIGGDADKLKEEPGAKGPLRRLRRPYQGGLRGAHSKNRRKYLDKPFH